MITKAVDSVADQFDNRNGIIENMETVRHLSDVLNTKIEKTLLNEHRRRYEPNDFVAISLTKREIEFFLWVSSKTALAADVLASELDTAHACLLDALNHERGAAR